MRRRTRIILALAAVAAALAGVYARHRLRSRPENNVAELTALLPAQTETVLYVDAADWRDSPLFARLLALAPQPQFDNDYKQFLQATGFDYEHDLRQIAMALWRSGAQTGFFAVLNGRFDRPKITAYALRNGTRAAHGSVDVYSLQPSGSARAISFTFLSANRIALSNDPGVFPFLPTPPAGLTPGLFERSQRLAGSPLFVILQPKSLSDIAISVTGGLRFDQLQSLAANWRWVTLAARPRGDRLQLIAEGECPSDDAARQLESTLNALLLITRAALDDPKPQRQMNATTRAALIETLQNAEVSRIDRGETKSVRLLLELNANLLEAAH